MKILTLILVFLCLHSVVSAQEVEVPFDSAGQITVVDKDMQAKYDLLPSYEPFQEAHLIMKPDSTFILEITREDSGKVTRYRFPKSAVEVGLLRELTSRRLGATSSHAKLDQSSRSKFLIWEALLSFFAYGPLITTSLVYNSNNVGLAAGLPFVIGGGGYLVSSLLTQNAEMNDGESSLALGGSFLGMAHGYALDVMLTNGRSGQAAGVLAAIGGITETVVGYTVAKNNKMSEGTADIIRYGGLFGMFDGGTLAYLFNSSPSPSFGSGLSLVGSAGGFAAGAMMAGNQPYTRGNASTVLTAGLYGPLVTLLLYSSVVATSFSNASAPQASGFAIASLVGNVGAIALAHSLMAGKRLSTGEGNIVILGTTAGALVGYGFGFIIVTGSNFSSASVWGFSLPVVLGVAAGFGLTVASIGKGSEERIKTHGDNSLEPTDAPNTRGWNIGVNPGSLAVALLPNSRPATSSSMANPVAPMVSLQYHW